MTATGYSEKQFVNVPIDQLQFGPNIRVDTGDLDTLTQQFNCRLPYTVLKLMRTRASEQHISVSVWLEEAILAHARR